MYLKFKNNKTKSCSNNGKVTSIQQTLLKIKITNPGSNIPIQLSLKSKQKRTETKQYLTLERRK